MIIIDADITEITEQQELEARREEANTCEMLFEEGADSPIPPSEMRSNELEQESIQF